MGLPTLGCKAAGVGDGTVGNGCTELWCTADCEFVGVPQSREREAYVRRRGM
jgi:hypothetical protein